MEQVRRYDRAELKPPVRTDAGFLRADAYLTRVGVFEYRRPDGSIRRELRLPEEVFRNDSLDSLQAAPLTLLHPETSVTPENVQQLSVGAVGTDVRKDADKVRATVTVMAAEAIKAVDQGMRELSCGYDCKLDETPGEWQGQRYDAIQRSIKYNHLAIVPEGRAGSEVRLHLDAADAVMVGNQRQEPGDGQKGKQAMAVIRIDSVDFEAPPQTAQAVTARLDSLQRRLDEAEQEKKDLEEEKDKLQAEKDALEEAKAKEDEEREKEDKEAEEKQDALIREAVKARVALERQAAPILGSEAKLDELDDLGVKKAVIAKLTPSAKLDDKSDVYIQARYDAAIEAQASQPNSALGQLRHTADAAGSSGKSAQERRDAMIARSRDAWKRPAGKGA